MRPGRETLHLRNRSRQGDDAAAESCHQNLDTNHALVMTRNIALGIHNKDFISRRISTRVRANGIVALTGGEKPVVTRIYDIGAGGLSFLHVDAREDTGIHLTMDVLLFDVHHGEELLIGQLKGRVTARELVADPVRKAPAWRYGVEFINLEAGQRRALKKCVGLALDRCWEARQTPVRKVA